METSSSFSQTARSAERGHPVGVRRAEGWAGLALGLVQAVGLSLVFLDASRPWGGLTRAVAQLVVLVGAVVMGQVVRRVGGVHPRGYRRRYALASVWAVAVVVVAGAFWVVPGHHDAGAGVTTSVAVAAVVPWLLVSAWLVREGR